MSTHKVAPQEKRNEDHKSIMAERRTRMRKTSAWLGLMKRWNRTGVVDIDTDHPAYHTLSTIRQGISELLTNQIHLGPKENLTNEDYEHVMEKAISTNGKTYTFCSYASPVFASIRRAINVSEEDYAQSLAPVEVLPYLEFISTSRSGQTFYLSTDMQYFIKTDTEKPVKFFLQILREYLTHFQSSPHSLLVKFLGVYSVKEPRSIKKYFLVMQSVFYPNDRIETKFDVKGCWAGRYDKPSPEDAERTDVPVLKDQDFWDKSIDLGPQRDWLMKQIEADCVFLSNLGVMDYSLLIGRQPLHTDERRDSISNLVYRVRKSLYDPISGESELDVGVTKVSVAEANQGEHGQVVPGKAVQETSNSEPRNGDPFEAPSHSSNNNSTTKGNNSVDNFSTVTSDKSKASSNKKRAQWSQNEIEPQGDTGAGGPDTTLLSLTDTVYLDSLPGHSNRRLLSNCKNSLHTIDGPKHRYFLGIIDFLTQYQLYQRVDCIRKDIKYRCGDHSSLPPKQYASRFLRFFKERTT